MASCDVAIIGGGPAGSTCARALKQAGMDVLVIDKAVFPRDKICAGWITPQVIAELEIDASEYARHHVLQPITSFVAGLRQHAAHDIDYGRTVSYGVRRCEFDTYLLKRSGARLRTGEAVKSIERDGALWRINDHITAHVLIGAGGHFCPVARVMGAALGRDELAVWAQEFEVQLTAEQLQSCRVSATRPELYFCADLKGYGWCFRKGDYLNIGLGREGADRLSTHVQAFRSWLIDAARIPADIADRFKGHAYLLHAHAARRVIDDGALLIGDAAGLAYTQSGEGIRPAIESALLAAEVIIEARGDYRAAHLLRYEAALTSRFGPRSAVQRRRPGLSPLRLALARTLMRRRWFTRRVLLDRWFLHASQPPLKCEELARVGRQPAV